METRPHRAQRRRAASETARTRLRKSLNKSRETFLQACQPATAASISACARSPACPTDEQRSRHRVFQRRSTPAEALPYRDSEYLRAQNWDLHPRAFGFVRGGARVAGHSVQFGRGEIRILHWNGSKTGEARRMIANHLRDVVV